MTTETVATVTNGRTAAGKFAPGNQAAAGHTHRQHVAKLRRAFSEALQPEDILNVVSKLLELALAGDIRAARLLLDRGLGKIASAEPDIQTDDTMNAVVELGPMTPENIEQHRAIRFARLTQR